MRPIVFAGPSLPPEAQSDAAFAWRGPAGAGDLLRLMAAPPAVVCLIDGRFDTIPSVWHKEILLLLAAGTRVIGGASMGALRAAELDRHGMMGVGRIYRAYRDGRLTGDDEVALAHLPERHGWKAVSEPLVDIRATLLAARRAGVVNAGAARTLLAAAKAIHFTDRDWPAVTAAAGLPTLLPWLLANRVALKRADALLCLAAAATPGPAPRPPPAPITRFVRDLAADCGVRLPAP